MRACEVRLRSLSHIHACAVPAAHVIAARERSSPYYGHLLPAALPDAGGLRRPAEQEDSGKSAEYVA